MVHDLIRHLVLWIYQHPNWAGLALFLLSAGESMTLIGSFIPGTILMTAVGIFIGADLLPYWPMVLWAACGTLFGDALNFTLGYYLKDNIKLIWPFKTHPHWLAKGQVFFEKHGGKSIYFARFIGPLRAFAPIIAGAMRMPAGKFYLMDTLSAFTWAITYLLPGLLLGEASLELPPDITEHLFRFVFLTLIAVIVGVWLIRLLVLHINEVIKNALSCLWTKMKETPSFELVCHLFRHHHEDHPRGQLGTLFVLLWVLMAFILLTVFVYAHHWFITTYNTQAYHLAQSLRTEWLNNILLFITALGEKKLLLVGFLATFAWLCYRRCWRAAIFWIGAFTLGVGSTYIFKMAVQFPRPNAAFEAIDGFSYPSGHVILATLFYGGLAYLGVNHRLLKFRWLGYIIACLLVILVAGSRAFLGVHWLSDIVGSILLGWLSLLLMALFYQRHPSQNIHPEKMLPVIIALQIALAWGYVHVHYLELTKEYFPKTTLQNSWMTTWWQQGYSTSKIRITNRLGIPQNTLNIQWAGNAVKITENLRSQGWKSALEPHNWVLEIQHPETKKPAVNLHLKKYFFEDKKPNYIFYKNLNVPETYMVLELWETPIKITPTNTPLYIGELTFKNQNKNNSLKLNASQLTSEFLQSLNKETVATKMLDNNQTIILIRAKK